MKRTTLLLLSLPILLIVSCSDGGEEQRVPEGPYAPTGRTKIVEGIEFVEIGPCSFLMGSEKGRGTERPVHRVTFERAFWIARHEVTNAQYERFVPDRERSEYSRGDRDPVVDVNWEEARAYCVWLADRSGLPVRLPSEAEWEASCRAGRGSKFCFGDDETGLGAYAWYEENSDERAHEVGTRKANAWGLHDLHGNVWEWCEDTWHDNYERAPTNGSARIDDGHPRRVTRGGCWDVDPRNCRSSARYNLGQRFSGNLIGFRLAMGPLDE